MKFLVPLVVVISIFFVSQMAIKNQDIRYLEPKESKVAITKKLIKEAGTEYVQQPIGKRMQTVPVTHIEEPTLYVDINGKIVPCIVSMSEFEQMNIGDEIEVVFYLPKYWGAPFAVRLK